MSRKEREANRFLIDFRPHRRDSNIIPVKDGTLVSRSIQALLLHSIKILGLIPREAEVKPSKGEGKS